MCRDDSPLIDEQEFWVRNLRYYKAGELPKNPSQSYTSFSDLSWNVGLFGWYPQVIPEQPSPIVDFHYEINETHMFFEETGTGAYRNWVGASTLVQTKGRYFSFEYEAKVERDPGHLGNFWIFYYDAHTREIIFTTQAGINLADIDPDADSGWIHFKHKIDLKSHDEVILLFTYVDTEPSNIHHKFWIRNLKIRNQQNFHIFNIGKIDEYFLKEDCSK